jgi:hypothetical protein
VCVSVCVCVLFCNMGINEWKIAPTYVLGKSIDTYGLDDSSSHCL